MRFRFAPLVPCALVLVLAGCAYQAPQRPMPNLDFERYSLLEQSEDEVLEIAEDYQLPNLADGLLAHGLSLVGTRYRYGGTSVTSGFDCSGFVGYLYQQEAGLKLPRSTREMINVDAPKVSRSDLEPGDLIFFNDRGRGRVSHAGIYLGDGQFIHSSSSRSGGVRIDSLQDSYWNRSYLNAKRVLALAEPSDGSAVKTQ